MLDRIDILLLKICGDCPGIALNELIESYSESVAEGPLELSPHGLRGRMIALEKDGLVLLDRTRVKRRVFCFITKKGAEELGRKANPSPSEADRL